MSAEDPDEGPRYASRRKKTYSRSGKARGFAASSGFGQRRARATTDHLHARGLGWWLTPAVKLRIAGFPTTFSWSIVVFLVIPLVWALLGAGLSAPLLATAFVGMVVSILVHELGHAFVARRYALAPIEIAVHGLGGFCAYTQTPDRRQRIAIALAGPAAGLGLAGLAALGAWALEGAGPWAYLDALLYVLAYVGALWSGLNLLPIRPLDGGAALTAFLHLRAPAVAMPVTWGVGLGTAGIASVVALVLGEYFIAILALFLAFDNGRGLWRWWQADQRSRRS